MGQGIVLTRVCHSLHRGDPTRYGQQVGGAHSTGMHTCSIFFDNLLIAICLRFVGPVYLYGVLVLKMTMPFKSPCNILKVYYTCGMKTYHDRGCMCACSHV